MHPVTRRVHYVWGLFRLFHREFTYPPLSLDDRALLVAGDAAMNMLLFCGTKHRPIHLEDLDQVYAKTVISV